jgi:hypothetical protein
VKRGNVKRSSLFLVAILALPSPFVFVNVMGAQEIRGQASASDAQPRLPSDILGPQLIVWSEQQQPQPVQEALPDSPEQRPALQTFTGTIMKMRGSFVLSLSNDTLYLLEESRLGELKGVEAYEGKQVRIQGKLDADTHILHVKSIEVIS